MSLQYISDTIGKKTAVIIPIDEWDRLKKKYPGIESFDDGVPEWQKEIVYSRRKLINQPGELMPVEEFLREMQQEADEEV